MQLAAKHEDKTEYPNGSKRNGTRSTSDQNQIGSQFANGNSHDIDTPWRQIQIREISQITNRDLCGGMDADAEIARLTFLPRGLGASLRKQSGSLSGMTETTR
jgi:hypothetical protein